MTGTPLIAIRGTDRVFPLPDGARLTAVRVPDGDVRLGGQPVSGRHCTIEVHWADVSITGLELGARHVVT